MPISQPLRAPPPCTRQAGEAPLLREQGALGVEPSPEPHPRSRARRSISRARWRRWARGWAGLGAEARTWLPAGSHAGRLRLLRVRGAGRPRYRCPGCRARYCSVSCYKTHKEQCIPRQDQVVKKVVTDTPLPFRRVKPGEDEGSCWSVEDILTEDDEGDRVPLQKLKRLGESKELKSLLLNPHLQQLLRTIDEAKEKESLMKTSMQEPLFVEFADCCLRVVEPPEKENFPLD